MKVKVSEAKGQVLDYLVAQAMGMKIYRSKSGRWMRANYGEFNHRLQITVNLTTDMEHLGLNRQETGVTVG
jgi:hypothetical protein